jgi:hypothetical protein
VDWRKILTLFRGPKMDPPVSLQFHATTPAKTKAAERIPAAQRPSFRVELRGLEPLTPTLPVWCATSCATAPIGDHHTVLKAGRYFCVTTSENLLVQTAAADPP